MHGISRNKTHPSPFRPRTRRSITFSADEFIACVVVSVDRCDKASRDARDRFYDRVLGRRRLFAVYDKMVRRATVNDMRPEVAIVPQLCAEPVWSAQLRADMHSFRPSNRCNQHNTTASTERAHQSTQRGAGRHDGHHRVCVLGSPINTGTTEDDAAIDDARRTSNHCEPAIEVDVFLECIPSPSRLCFGVVVLFCVKNRNRKAVL